MASASARRAVLLLVLVLGFGGSSCQAHSAEPVIAIGMALVELFFLGATLLFLLLYCLSKKDRGVFRILVFVSLLVSIFWAVLTGWMIYRSWDYLVL